jgi:cell wall-associated NlpC family hydrolase
VADSQGGISGLGIGFMTVGGLLVASAIRNVAPVDTLRAVLGRPSQGRPISPPFGATASGVRGVVAAPGSAAAGVAGGSAGDGGRLVEAARRYLGVRYVFGGATRSGVDCSGLVYLALKDIGMRPPRFTTYTFGAWASSIGATRMPGGRLAFVAGDVILRTGHMGIALGGGRLIHAPHTGTVVQEATIWDPGNWWGWRLPSAPSPSLSPARIPAVRG